MSSHYTPTTTEIREEVAWRFDGDAEANAYAAFDRWLAKVQAEAVAAERERLLSRIAIELPEMLSHEVHAPASTHSAYDGSCSECPWPLHELPPEDMAREMAAMLHERHAVAIRTPDPVSHVSEEER